MRIEDGPDGLRFELPARRKWSHIVFLPVCLTAFYYAEAFSFGLGASAQTPSLLRALSVACFLLITACALYSTVVWLRLLLGQEQVLVTEGRLVHRTQLLGLSRSRTYDLDRMTNLRISPKPIHAWDAVWDEVADACWGYRKHKPADVALLFEYGTKTIRFTTSVNEAGGAMMIERIHDHSRNAHTQPKKASMSPAT